MLDFLSCLSPHVTSKPRHKERRLTKQPRLTLPNDRRANCRAEVASRAIGVRTGMARWAMAPPNASAGAPRRAVNAGSPVKVGWGPPESEGPPPRVPVRFIGFY